MLLVALVVALVFLAPAPESGQDPSQGNEHSTKVVIVEDADDPRVWENVEAFCAEPTAENTRAAFRVLEEKLSDWPSHPAGMITTILETIGERKIGSGREYVVRFLRTEPTLARASIIQSTAARALGLLGGIQALEELVRCAESAPPSVLPSVAVALGLLADPRAVTPLEVLANRPDPETKARALSALSKYCSSTSKSLALDHLASEAEDVKKSAAWWLSQCGTGDDGPRLASLLHDGAELVRLNALKGLVRLNSKAACDMSESLLHDESDSVRALAREYSVICVQTER